MSGPDKPEGIPQKPHNLPPSNPASPIQHFTNKTSSNDHPRDSIELSPENTEYRQILKRIEEVPDVRSDRVERIRQALESGTYQINSRIIADRILQELRTDDMVSDNPPDTSLDSPSS